jgi:hypothetical protein
VNARTPVTVLFALAVSIGSTGVGAALAIHQMDGVGSVSGALAIATAAAQPEEAPAPGPTDDRVQYAVGLRPVAATLRPFDLDDAAEEAVRVQFGRFVAAVGDVRRFRALTTDGQFEVGAADARLVVGTADEVEVLFRPGTDLRQVALVVVDAGAVVDEGGRASVPGALALADAKPGPLPGPHLVDATADATLDRVRYHFDRQLGPDATVAPKDFHVVSSDGRSRPGTSLVSISQRTVVIDFDVDLDDVARFVSRAGATHDRFLRPSVLSAIGSTTGAPDLLSATRVGRTSVELTFDEPVVVDRLDRIGAVLDDGELTTSTSFVKTSPTVVQVSFRSLQDQPHALAALTVGSGAVRALSPDATPATVAMVQIGPVPDTGRTARPDPVSVDIDADSGLVTVVFDEPLDEHRVDPARIHLLTSGGRLVPATALVEVEDHRLVVTAPPNVARSAVSVVLDTATAVDRGGGLSTPATLVA